MLGSGLLLKIDEEKAHLPGVALSSGCVDVSSAHEVCGLELGTALCLQTPPGLQAGHLSGRDLGFSSLFEASEVVYGVSGGWCGLSCVSSDSSGAVE